MKFKGYIEGLELSDVIQILNMKGANCIIEVSGPNNEKGLLYIQNGNIVYAETEDGTRGNEAALKIFSWESGSFRELLWVPPPEINVKMDTMFLMMEAARLKDEKLRKGESGLTSQHLSNNDLLTQFLLGSKDGNELRRRALSLLIYNFPENIIIAGITNFRQKNLSFLISPNYKEKFWHIFRKAHPAIKISQEHEERPLFIPFEKGIDAAILTREYVTIVTILRNFTNDSKIFHLINKILDVITRVK